MHSQIEPNNEIFLHQAFSIEESVKIDHRLVNIILIVGMSR